MRERILRDAGEQEASKVLGVKQRSLFGLKTRFNWEHHEAMGYLHNFIKEEIGQRQRTRRTVNLPWLHRVVAKRVRDLKDIGVVPMYRGREIKGSYAFCWMTLVKFGYVSRKRSKARATTPEAMAAAMHKWLHFFRSEVLRTDEDMPDAEGEDGDEGALEDDVLDVVRRIMSPATHPRSKSSLVFVFYICFYFRCSRHSQEPGMGSLPEMFVLLFATYSFVARLFSLLSPRGAATRRSMATRPSSDWLG